MRSIVIAALLLSIFIEGAAAQQGPAAPTGSPPNGSPAGSAAPKTKGPTSQLSRLFCAEICSKGVSEKTLSDDEQKQFDLCANALLCQGRQAPPLVYQPRHDDDNEDGGIGGYFLRKYRDIIG